MLTAMREIASLHAFGSEELTLRVAGVAACVGSGLCSLERHTCILLKVFSCVLDDKSTHGRKRL